MSNIEIAVQILTKNIPTLRCDKSAPCKYSIFSGLFLSDGFTSLPIFLVELNNRLYFADYGMTIRAFQNSFDTAGENIKKLAENTLAKLGVTLDGQNITMEVGSDILQHYNNFVMAIMFLQALFA